MTHSINTNEGAYVALHSLNATSSALAATEKRISTGYRVADATDDGGAFAVAQKVRSDVGALTSVNQQLGTAKGLVTTTLSSLTSISDSFTSAKGLLAKIADSSISDDQRTQYISNFQQLVSHVADAVDGSTYDGQSLLGSVAGGPVAGTAKKVISNESGSQHTLSAEDNSGTAATLAGLIGITSFTRSAAGVDTFGSVTPAAAQTAAAAALASGAGFDTAQTALNNQLNQAGADSKYLDSQVTFNSSKIDSLNSGLGALVDADLSQESAQLQSLQIKQQLGTQALSIANQAPQALLSLFR